MTQQELNSIKEKFSIAYLHAINAKVNFALNKSDNDFDGLCIDYEIINKPVGLGRSVASEMNEIKIQLKGVSKSSTTMLRETGTEIEYNITNAIIPIGVFYLIVVILPEEEALDTWLEHTPEQLVLRKCAYFLRIVNTLNPGFVKIPKSNLLTPTSLPTLFLSSTNKEDLL